MLQAAAFLFANGVPATGMYLMYYDSDNESDVSGWHTSFIGALIRFVGKASWRFARTADLCSCHDIDIVYGDDADKGNPHRRYQCRTHLFKAVQRVMFCRREQRAFFMKEKNRDYLEGIIPYEEIAGRHNPVSLALRCQAFSVSQLINDLAGLRMPRQLLRGWRGLRKAQAHEVVGRECGYSKAEHVNVESA